MKNILVFIIFSLTIYSCHNQEVFTINCSKNTVLNINSSGKHIHKIKLELNNACCDSIAVVCVELNGQTRTDDEIIEIAQKHDKKIYLDKNNLEYMDDWY